MKRRLPAHVLALLLLCSTAYAQTTSRDLVLAPLEDLMRIEITSAARKEQRAGEVAAAVHVITQDDIRRSGIRSLPELFRLVPGMQVAALNSNSLAVSIRGFNDVFANKVLVLIDGRSIYTRTFSGVFWHAEDMMLEDIDRIEVVRGPGGVSWGANAVNGVVNIITKAAADTQGTLVRVGTGTHDSSEGAVRYGGRVGRTYYRLFGQWADHGAGAQPTGRSAVDTWNSVTSGFRTDWSSGAHALMTEGSLVEGRQHPLWMTNTVLDSTVDESESSSRTGNLLARWTYSLAPDTSLQIQSFYSRQRLNEALLHNLETEADVDLSYHTRRGRHELVTGGGYRWAGHADDGGTFTTSFPGAAREYHTVNVFAQDEIRIARRLRATIGAKIEHDAETGANFQPTSRLIWDVVPDRQHLWVAVSRAVRRPSLIDLHLERNQPVSGASAGLPMIARLSGNQDLESEKLLSTEAGYRVSAGSKLSADFTAFRGRYEDLTRQEPGAPFFEAAPAPAHLVVPLHFTNLTSAVTSGAEVSVRVMPTPAWRVEGSFTVFRATSNTDATSRKDTLAVFDPSAPAHQWQLHSSWSLAAGIEVDAHLYQVAQLRNREIPGYARVDARIQYPLTPRLSIVGTGQNLFSDAHAEFANDILAQTLVRRAVHADLVWRF
jgi:iron complex outermembrane receptor protein